MADSLTTLSQMFMNGGGGGSSPLNFSLPPMDDAAPAAAAPAKRGVSFLEDILPSIVTGFGSGMAARQRDPEALMRVLMTFIEGKEQKRRSKVLEEAQRLREQREGRLMESAATTERLRQETAAETERRNKATEARAQVSDRNALINTAEDNLRAMFGEEGNYNPAALGEYIQQQSGRVKPLGGDPAEVEALLMSLATQMSQRRPQNVPYIERAPGTPAPTTVPRGAVVRNAPQPRVPREPPRPLQTTDEEGNIYLVDPKGNRITPKPIGKRPKTGGNDALDKIIAEAAAGGGAAAPNARPAPAAAKTPQVGAVVTIGGKKKRITKVYPNGRFDAVDVQ